MTVEAVSKKRERCREIIAILKKEYPDAHCTLDFQNAFQLLIATILAAQCTDERVNKVTPGLFHRFPTPTDFAEADPAEMEAIVRPTGFFRQKTKALMSVSHDIVTKFDGMVPDNIDDLLSMHGVGRKTANLILGTAYGQAAIVVDTHVKRVTNRLELSFSTNPDKIEMELANVVPEEEWSQFNHLMVFHGRKICKAPTPLCEICLVIALCPFGQNRLKQAGKQ